MFRYQVQGPNALELMEQVAEGPLPEIRFFNMAELGIAGLKVRALRHGMAGQPGYELSGPWELGEEVKGSIVEAGQEHGLRQVGTVAYQTATAESGWIPCPVPAIYTGDRLKRYREWLPAASYEGTASLGGSLYSDDIGDYYLTPYELGYGSYVKLDHDFVGREALAEMADRPRRKKVTLVWNRDDVIRVFATLLDKGTPGKYIGFPSNWYSMIHYDQVVKGGEPVGISTYGGYTVNERAMLSLACINTEHLMPDLGYANGPSVPAVRCALPSFGGRPRAAIARASTPAYSHPLPDGRMKEAAETDAAYRHATKVWVGSGGRAKSTHQ
jgi:vanillate/3-O-methylgallate O-demethylase